jgi:hypothetical protein
MRVSDQEALGRASDGIPYKRGVIKCYLRKACSFFSARLGSQDASLLLRKATLRDHARSAACLL